MNERAVSILRNLLKRPVAYHRIFAQIGGGACAGLMLSQAWYWTDKGEDGWFYKSMQEWEEETGLTRTEQETARERLKKNGLLEEKRAGMPARLYFRVNVEMLVSLIAEKPQTSMQETRKQEAPKPANMNAEKPQSTNIRITETTPETTAKRLASVKPTQPVKPKLSQADPRTSHPAIRAVKALMQRNPERVLYDDLIEALGETPDMRKLSDCRKAWVKAGYNTNSLTWALEWYRDGIPERNGNGKPGFNSKQRTSTVEQHRENHERFVRRGAA